MTKKVDKETFIKKLQDLAPSKEDVRKYDVKESFVEEQIGRYIAHPKATYQLIRSDDEVINMLQAFDCSTVGIGILSFAKEVKEERDCFIIGKVEIDPLVINKITKEVEVRDHTKFSHVIWPCAANGDRFLDALYICAECLTAVFRDLDLGDNSDFLFKYVVESTDKAGGEKYIDFYKMLLMYFD
jgi:hypothetical protein